MTGFSDTWQQMIDLAGTGEGVRAPGRALRHSDTPWTSAAAATDELGGRLARIAPDLAATHDALPAATGGFDIAGALRAVRSSWEDRLATARDECADLGGALRAVVRDQGRTEQGLRASFASAVPEQPAGGHGVAE